MEHFLNGVNYIIIENELTGEEYARITPEGTEQANNVIVRIGYGEIKEKTESKEMEQRVFKLKKKMTEHELRLQEQPETIIKIDSDKMARIIIPSLMVQSEGSKQ